MTAKKEKKKRYQTCDFQKRHRKRYPDKEVEGLEEVITFHTCSLVDAGLTCTYPAVFCRYKKEMEDIGEVIQQEGLFCPKCEVIALVEWAPGVCCPNCGSPLPDRQRGAP